MKVLLEEHDAILRSYMWTCIHEGGLSRLKFGTSSIPVLTALLLYDYVPNTRGFIPVQPQILVVAAWHYSVIVLSRLQWHPRLFASHPSMSYTTPLFFRATWPIRVIHFSSQNCIQADIDSTPTLSDFHT